MHRNQPISTGYRPEGWRLAGSASESELDHC